MFRRKFSKEMATRLLNLGAAMDMTAISIGKASSEDIGTSTSIACQCVDSSVEGRGGLELRTREGESGKGDACVEMNWMYGSLFYRERSILIRKGTALILLDVMDERLWDMRRS